MAVDLQLERALEQEAQLLGRKLVAGEEVKRHPRIVVLTWNLFHGRDDPPNPALHTWRSRLLRVTERDATHAQVNRPLLDEFAAALAALEWDVALLQEVPPGWLRALATAAGAGAASVLTSRNVLHVVRGALARLNPDLIASAEGGSNQLLMRAPWRIDAVERETIARRPERRRMLLARLIGPEDRCVTVSNLHASTGEAAAGDVMRAARTATAWAGGGPLVFGGDLNLSPASRPDVFRALEREHGLRGPTPGDAIDHLLVRGLVPLAAPRRLPDSVRELALIGGGRIRLSDHPCVAGSFEVE